MECPAPPSRRDSLAGDSNGGTEFGRWAKERRSRSAAGNASWRQRDDFNGSDCRHRQDGDFRTWSRLCGMAGLGPASIDDRRQGPPACDAMDRRDRAFSTERARNALYLLVSLPGAPGENLWIRPSVRACGTGFPVRQRLALYHRSSAPVPAKRHRKLAAIGSNRSPVP